jgi:hypothetical protein
MENWLNTIIGLSQYASVIYETDDSAHRAWHRIFEVYEEVFGRRSCIRKYVSKNYRFEVVRGLEWCLAGSVFYSHGDREGFSIIDVAIADPLIAVQCALLF